MAGTVTVARADEPALRSIAIPPSSCQITDPTGGLLNWFAGGQSMINRDQTPSVTLSIIKIKTANAACSIRLNSD